MTYHLPIGYPLCPFYGHLSNLWLSLAFSVQNEPAARAHQACKAESTHHPFHLVIDSPGLSILARATIVRTMYHAIDDLVSAPPKFPRQLVA
jgi:hypothetical protein